MQYITYKGNVYLLASGMAKACGVEPHTVRDFANKSLVEGAHYIVVEAAEVSKLIGRAIGNKPVKLFDAGAYCLLCSALHLKINPDVTAAMKHKTPNHITKSVTPRKKNQCEKDEDEMLEFASRIIEERRELVALRVEVTSLRKRLAAIQEALND